MQVNTTGQAFFLAKIRRRVLSIISEDVIIRSNQSFWMGSNVKSEFSGREI